MKIEQFDFNERGFLSNYPLDVIRVINGQPITKADILSAKRERQQEELITKRLSYEDIVKPCFIWTFYNRGFPYGGWWLYVKTAQEDWGEFRGVLNTDIILKIMQIYPCGILPMYSMFEEWKAAFAKQYFYPTEKRPKKQGMAVAKAVINHSGHLKDVLPFNNNKGGSNGYRRRKV